MTTQLATTQSSPVVIADRKDLDRTIAQIAAVLPPKLSEDMPFKAWMKLVAETVGDHPIEVLAEARSVILSTCQFAPTPKEFVDAVLAAYARRKLPLSEDAKRHLAYRKKTSHRYIVGEDGKERFIDDAKLTTISFVSVAGVHANMVMDYLPAVTVSNVERGLLLVSKDFEKREKATIDEIVSKLKYHSSCDFYHRAFGTPEQLCGGTPAEVRGRYGLLKSHRFAVSTKFMAALLQECPDVTNEEIWEVYFKTVYHDGPMFPDNYGTTYQAEMEDLFRRKVLDLQHQKSRQHKRGAA